MKMRSLCLISLALAKGSGFAATETLSLPTGYSLIADHLDAPGGNTLNNILPNPPPGTTFHKWSCAGWTAYTFDEFDLVWTPNGLATLNPGEGALINLPFSYTITFSGSPHVPILPVVLPCGCDHFNLLSRQTTNAPTTFQDLTGFNPSEGTRLYRYIPGALGGPSCPFGPPCYTVYTFSGGAWGPSTPTLNMGESAFVNVPCSTNAIAQKWLEVPDTTTNGIDVRVTGQTMLADDFRCTATGPITEVRIWGSWLNDSYLSNACFCLGLWTDVPKSATNYSQPGRLLCERCFIPGQYTQFLYTNVFYEQFWDPLNPIPGLIDSQVWEYVFTMPANSCWLQTNGNTYWLSVRIPAGCFDTSQNQFGWKTCPTNWNDDAVYGFQPGNGWQELRRPPSYTNSLDLAFQITTATNSTPPCCPDTGGVKYLQSPDLTNGTDVNAMFTPADPLNSLPWVLADDFPCTNRGPITDIHLWGSWLHDQVDLNAVFTLAIWGDVPASPSPPFISHPGQLLWTQTYTNGQYVLCPYANQFEDFYNGDSVFYGTPTLLGSSSNLFYLCFNASPTNTFYQTGTPTAPTNYWLSVTVQSFAGDYYFGWKSSATAYNDTAVAAFNGSFYPQPGDWAPMYNAQNAPLSMAFKITTATNPCPSLTLLCSNLTITCGSPIPTNPPAWSDPCCTNVVVSLIGSAVTNTGCSQIIYQTWQARDLCYGISNTCVRVVTVLPSSPTLLCGNLTINCGSPIPTNPPAYMDLCCTNVTVSLLSSTTTNPGCGQIISQTWRAVDQCCGTSNTCVRVVTILPSTPTLLCSNLTIACGSPIPTNPPAYTDLCCTNVTVALLSSTTTNPGCGQIISQTWQAVDHCCGTSNTCVRVVTVLPSTPTLLCSNLTITCGSPIPTNPPTYTDLCCTNVTVSLVTSTVTNPGCGQIISQTWQAVDQCCGTSNTCVRVVTVLPSTPTLLCSNLTIACGSPVPTNPPAYTDLCCTNVTVSLLSSTTTNPGCGQIISQTWQALDQCCGTSNTCVRVVTVLPSTPTLLCSNVSITCGSPIPTNPPAYTDSCCTNVTVTLVTSTTTNTGCGQTISQTWRAVDQCCGTSNTCVRVVTILPSTPTLLCSNLTIACGSPIPTNPPAYIDLCCTNVTVALLSSTTTNPGCGQIISQTWRAVDQCCGTSNTCVRVVTVLPSAPTLLCSNLTITCGSPIPTNPPAYIDLCCTNVTVTLIGNTVTNPGCGQIISQTWQALDQCCGTSNTCVRVVTVLPSIPTLLCSNLTITCGGPIPTNPPAYIDLCCTNVKVTLIGSTGTNTGCSQTITQTWQTVDQCCGTSNSCVRVVTVLPSAPTLLCSNLTIACGSPIPTNPPAYIDLCCSNVTVTLLGSSSSGTGCVQTITQTWRATDQCCGTSNVCTRTITVLPSTPTLLCSNLTIACGSPIPTNPPGYIDLCCSNVTVTLLGSSSSGTGCVQTITQTWQAYDQCCGTSNTCVRVITILSLPPTITCPSNFLVQCIAPHGTPLFRDNFNTYSNGNLVGQGPWVQTGTSTNSPIQVAFGKALLGSAGQDAQAVLSPAATIPDGSTFYIGVTINVSAAQATGDYFLHVAASPNPATTFYEHVYIKSSGAGFVLGYAPTSGAPASYGGNVLQFNTSYRLVIAYHAIQFAANDTADLYVNPTDPVNEGNNPSYLHVGSWGTATPESGVVGTINLRQGAAAGGATLTVDDLAASLVFADAASGSELPQPANLAEFIAAGATVITNCDTNLQYYCVDGPLVGGTCGGTITRTNTVVNGCSNSVSCIQIITVHDTIPPVVVCATNRTVACGTDWSFEQPYAYDNCCSNLTYQLIRSNATFVSACQSVYAGVWQVSDCCSNTSVCTQWVTVATSLALVCSNQTILCGSPIPTNPPAYTDSCCSKPPSFTLLSTNTSSNGCGLVISRVWQAVDCCSNIAYCTESISVVSPPPSITCPSNFTIQCLPPPGAPLFSDNFNLYTNGNLVGQGPWVQTGTSSNSPLQVAYGRALLAGGPGQDANVALSPPVTLADGATFYLGVTINVSAADSAGDYFLHVAPEAGPFIRFYDRVFIRGAGAGFQLGYLGTAGGATNYGSTILSFNTNYRLVVACQVVPGPLNDTASLYVDPADTVVEANNPAYLVAPWTSTNAETNVVGTINLRQGASTAAPVLSVDNLSASLVFADVAAVSGLLPPATLAEFIAAGGTVITNCNTNFQYYCVDGPLTGGPCGGTISRTHTVVDGCSNASSCVQLITVHDTIPPVISCSSNKTVQCGSGWIFDQPRASDNCCTNLTYSLLSSNGTPVTPCVTLYAGVWQVTDCCSNNSVCTQLVTEVKSGLPIVTPGILLDYSAVPGARIVFAGGGFAFVGDTNGVQFEIDDVLNGFGDSRGFNGYFTSGGPFTIGTISPLGPGETAPVTGSAILHISDGTQEFTGTVQWLDITTLGTSGVLNLNGQVNLTGLAYLGASPDLRALTASLTAQVDLTFQFIPARTLTQLKTAGGFTDYSGTIVGSPVVTNAPLITCTTNKTVTCGTPWTFDPPTPASACCTNLTIIPMLALTNVNGCERIISQVWKAYDCCSNSVICTQVVTVRPSAPTLLCSNLTINCGSPVPTNPPAWFDACCTNVTVTMIGSTTTNIGCNPTIYQTWQALDHCCGTSNTCVRVITVVDTVPPVITCPSNIVIVTCSTNVPVSWSIMATDACSSVTVTSTPPSGSLFKRDTTNIVTAVATDGCGNTNTCSFLVIVRKPILNIAISGSGFPVTITITWLDGGILQQADSVLGPWTDVPVAMSPYTVAASVAQKFYRLRCP